MSDHFSLVAFSDKTKHLCSYFSLALFLLMAAYISPCKHITFISMPIKIITVALLLYILYMNILQTNYLNRAKSLPLTPNVSSQIAMNVAGSYAFSLFIGLLIIISIKSSLVV
jgi:hypothetical protein